MKLLIQSAMIFFGTLMAAGLVALGEPAGAHGERSAMHETAGVQVLNRLVESARPWLDWIPAQRGR